MRRTVGMAAVVLAAVALGWVALGTFRDEAAAPPAPSSAAPSAARESSGSSPTASPPAEHEGHDHEGHSHDEGIDGEAEQVEPDHSQDGTDEHTHDYAMPAEDKAAAIDVATRFVDGWLEADAQQRVAALAGVATPALVESLSDPRTRVWKALPAGDPELLHVTATAVSVRQSFTDGRAVDLLLIYDPTTDPVWAVSDVQPSKES